MGVKLQNMVLRSIIVIAIVAFAHGLPTADDVVPESARGFDEAEIIAPHDAAKQIVTEMIQAGSNYDACTELANTTRTEVTESVESKQQMLDSLDKGCSCKLEGQDEVNRTQYEMEKADHEYNVAKETTHSALTAQVQLGSQEYSTLRAQDCGWIKQDAAYLSAKETWSAAVLAESNAKIVKEEWYRLYVDAFNTAIRLREECECKTQVAHRLAWAEANEDNDANAAAWSQSHHIDCVIAHTSEANCVFVSAPFVNMPTVCDNIDMKDCSGGASSGSGTD